MISHYFKIALRTLSKNGLGTLLNVVNIAVGIACVGLIFLILQQQLQYDQFHKNLSRLYVVQEASTDFAVRPTTVIPALPAMLTDLTFIESGTRIVSRNINWISHNELSTKELVTHVDPAFFKVFSFPLKWGNTETALREPGDIVLSEEVSQKLFKDENPVGRTVKLDNGRSYTVRGVMQEIPINSTYRPRVVMPINDILEASPMADDWLSSNCPTVLLVRPGVNLHSIAGSLNGFVKKYYKLEGTKRTLTLMPFGIFYQTMAGPLYKIILYGLVMVGVFIILIVVINFLNLYHSLSLNRLQEVAVKFALGSKPAQIFMQFMLECLLITSAAAILGLLLLAFILPLFSWYFEWQVKLNVFTNWELLVFIVTSSILFGLGTSFYSSMSIRKFRLTGLTKGNKFSVSKGFNLQGVFVAVQFTLSVFLISATLIMNMHIKSGQKSDLGFNRNRIVTIPLNQDFKEKGQVDLLMNNFIESLSKQSTIDGITASSVIPGRYDYNSGTFFTNNVNVGTELQKVYIDANYMDVFGLHLESGRNFSTTMSTDSLEAAILNQRAVKALGLRKALGTIVVEKGTGRRYTVVGVLNDYQYQGALSEVQPLIHLYSGKSFSKINRYISVKYAPGSEHRAAAFFNAHFTQVPMYQPFKYFYLEEQLNKQYSGLQKTQTFIGLASLIAVVIACSGVFALTVLTISQRFCEVSVRKVLGASNLDIIKLFSFQLIKPVSIGVLCAVPLTVLLMNKWLNTFPYQIQFPWWVFSISGTLAVGITFLTVIGKLIKASSVNPTVHLRR